MPKIATRNGLTVGEFLIKYTVEYLGFSFLTASSSEEKLLSNMCALERVGKVAVPLEDYEFVLARAVGARMKIYRPDPGEVV